MDDSSSSKKKTATTTDEVIASVKITLASWNQAFEPPLNDVDDEESGGVENNQSNTAVEGGGGGAADDNTRKKQLTTMIRRNNRHQPLIWRDTDAYQRRLSTFRPNTYFAKPLALSPLVCAAFG